MMVLTLKQGIVLIDDLDWKNQLYCQFNSSVNGILSYLLLYLLLRTVDRHQQLNLIQ